MQNQNRPQDAAQKETLPSESVSAADSAVSQAPEGEQGNRTGDHNDGEGEQARGPENPDQGLEEIEVVAGDAGCEAEADQAVNDARKLVNLYSSRFKAELQRAARELAAESGRDMYSADDVQCAWKLMRLWGWSPER